MLVVLLHLLVTRSFILSQLMVIKVGGLLLFWKNNVILNVIVANVFMFNCIVLGNGFAYTDEWQLTLVYSPPIPSLKPYF